MVDPKAVSKLKDHMEELRKFGVKRIGSYLARQQDEGSDIYLVVEFEKRAWKKATSEY